MAALNSSYSLFAFYSFCPFSEMGLGKTVQIVSLFEHLKRMDNISGPFLVVVPLGTISHWKREFENWTDFNCLVYHDAVRGKETRRLIRETEWNYDMKQIKFIQFHSSSRTSSTSLKV